MLDKSHAPASMDSAAVARELTATTLPQSAEVKKFLKGAVLFMFVGILLFGLVYAASDQLIYNYGKRNRFYMVKTAPLRQYDAVILGASHAAVFDYEDMNARLEELSGAKIINLSVVGGGIVPNRLLLEYFLADHETSNVIYFVDSFAFYSRDWNEDRLQDTRLFDRAPFDLTLARVLVNHPAARTAALDYLVGFSRINNADRFKPDISEEEATRFDKTYRPVKQIDEQRLAYLYPKEIDPATFRHYLTEFEDLLKDMDERNIRVIVIKVPVPERWYRMLPEEDEFDAALKPILERHNAEFYDFSLVGNDEKYFYNTDHLNRDGVLNFFEHFLAPLFQ